MTRYSLKTGKPIEENTALRMTRTLGALRSIEKTINKSIQSINEFNSGVKADLLISGAPDELNSYLDAVEDEEVFNDTQISMARKLIFALEKAIEKGAVNPIKELLLQIKYLIRQLIHAPNMAKKVHNLKELGEKFLRLYRTHHMNIMIVPHEKHNIEPEELTIRKKDSKEIIIATIENSRTLIDKMYDELKLLKTLSSSWRGVIAKEIGTIESSLNHLERIVKSGEFPEEDWYNENILEPMQEIHNYISEFEIKLLNAIKRQNPDRVVQSYMNNLERLQKRK